MPVFMKAGAIVPMQKHLPFNADLDRQSYILSYLGPQFFEFFVHVSIDLV